MRYTFQSSMVQPGTPITARFWLIERSPSHCHSSRRARLRRGGAFLQFGDFAGERSPVSANTEMPE